MGHALGSAARVLEQALARDPNHEALVTRGVRLTYGQLDELANRAVHTLFNLGVRPGDRVCASLPNDFDVVVAFHGVMRLGAIWVGINRVLADPEKHHILSDCKPTIYLTDTPLQDDQGSLVGIRIIDVDTWRTAIESAPSSRWSGPDPDPLAPAGIAYTSGTTGRPKGAVHSQHNLMLPGSVLVQSRDYKPDLRKGDCFAFTILNMAVLTTLLVSQAGGTSIVMDRTDPEGIADWIKREKITTWNGAPAMLHSLVTSDSVTANDLLTLDEVWVGGADCPDAIRRAFYTKFGLPVLATYGLSEAPTVIAIDDRPSSRSHKPVAPVGSSGKPLPHLRIRIVGADGSTLQQGEAGQICISAADDRYRTMLGYLNSPEATNDVIVDHELRTGDVGLIDENGYLHIRDRLSLVIIRGGANIYPAEIERVVAEFPGINASAAVGLPDERLGERVALLIELSDGAQLNDQELATHLAENLARYKIPEQIKVIDAFPRNAMGKIQRRGLVDYFTDATR